MIEWFQTFYVIIAAAIIGGAGIGTLGAYVVGMRIPFIAIVISHAAMLGGVLAYLLKWPAFPVSLFIAILGALLLGKSMKSKSRGESTVQLSILFSLLIGLTFLAMGLVRHDMTPVLSLMWGSLLFVKPGDLIIMCVVTAILFIFAWIFHRELKAILFSRRLAESSGIPAGWITAALIGITAGMITASLDIVGGLLIYSLLTCPAAAAYKMGSNLKSIIFLSGLFGIMAAAGGFFISWETNLPTGSCITLTAVSLYGMVHLWRIRYPIG